MTIKHLKTLLCLHICTAVGRQRPTQRDEETYPDNQDDQVRGDSTQIVGLNTSRTSFERVTINGKQSSMNSDLLQGWNDLGSLQVTILQTDKLDIQMNDRRTEGSTRRTRDKKPSGDDNICWRRASKRDMSNLGPVGTMMQ